MRTVVTAVTGPARPATRAAVAGLMTAEPFLVFGALLGREDFLRPPHCFVKILLHLVIQRGGLLLVFADCRVVVRLLFRRDERQDRVIALRAQLMTAIVRFMHAAPRGFRPD